MPRGLFISFEGGEGAGKTTQIARLKARLEQSRKSVITTREPGGTPGAEAIRKLLVEGEASKWDAKTECLLHFAARRDHAHKVIMPAIHDGKVVLTDRFFHSTYAYQGYGQGLPLEEIDLIRHASIGTLAPDLTLLLDLPAEKGLKRASTQQRYEKMGLAFHEKLRQGFLEMAKKDQHMLVINADQAIDAVEQAVWEAVQKKL